MTTGAIAASATRSDPISVKEYLDGIRTTIDIDGDGKTDALTDGLLILRYLFGLGGTALTNNAVGPNATRPTAATIVPYIQSLMP